MLFPSPFVFPFPPKGGMKKRKTDVRMALCAYEHLFFVQFTPPRFGEG